MDDELRALLIEEVERHRRELVPGDLAGARRVAHSLRGSFGMAGEREVGEFFARIGRRLAAGDERAIGELADAIAALSAPLSLGRPLPHARWPEPPEDLIPTVIDRSAAEDYAPSMRDRLARIDALLSRTRSASPEGEALEVYREVHTMKGAALSVGDEVMAWFCHGLEEHLRRATTPEDAEAALAGFETYRGVLAEIVDAPAHAIATLRLMAGAPARPSRPPLFAPLPLPPRRPATEVPHETDHRALSEEGTVRVPRIVLDAIFDRVGQLAHFRGPLAAGSSGVGHAASVARELSRSIKEALRMIGPPRPWGAPAAAIDRLERCVARLAPLASELDATALRVGSLGSRLGRDGDTLGAAVSSLRTTYASSLFDRIAAAAQTEARRTDRPVEIVTSGGETPIDRRLVEALVEPLRQLTRNAVVHGLEAPDEREAAGKTRTGTIRLSAAQRLGSLVLTVSDDGAGVDAARVRSHAVEVGLISSALADTLGDDALLTLLFYPGFSMRSDSDLLAGRGVGLDLTLAAVHRIGGTIHLESKPGQGLTATIAVSSEGAMVKVVWLTSGSRTFAMQVQHTGRVAAASDVPGLLSLGALLGDPDVRPPALAIEVVAPFDREAGVHIGVDAVGPIDEVALRALPPIARATGPWSAAVVWTDEIRLTLDPTRVLHLARVGRAA